MCLYVRSWYVSREDTQNLIRPQPKSPLSLQHHASCRGGERLLVCLLEFTCLSAKTYIRLSLKWIGSSDACVSTPQYRELRKLRADSAEGEPSAVFWVAPLGWARPTLDPWSLWSWKQQGASMVVSLSPRLIPVTADSPWTGQNWGRCDGNKDLGRSRDRGVET